jgi:hypothetical protein
MGIVKDWTLTFCTVMIICAFISVFIPRDSHASLVRVILSAFMIYTILIPVSKGFDLKELRIPEIIETEIDTCETDRKLIETNIRTYLESSGVNGVKIDCDVNTNGGIPEIEYIRIYIPDDYSKEEVKEQIYNDLGFVTEVNYIGD